MLNFVTPNNKRIITSGTVTQIQPQIMRLNNVQTHVFVECDDIEEFLLWCRHCLKLGGLRILDQLDDYYIESLNVSSVSTDENIISCENGSVIYDNCSIQNINGIAYFTAIRTYA